MSGEGLGWVAIGAKARVGVDVRFEVSARRSVFLQGRNPLSIGEAKPKAAWSGATVASV